MMDPTLHILHLEDDPVDTELVRELLEADGLSVEIHRVDTLDEFLNTLHCVENELIITDFTVPGVDAVQALQRARTKCPDVPVIFLSGTMGEELAIDLLKRGATDYVLKQRIQRLPSAVRRAMQEATEQRHRRAAEEALKEAHAELEQRVIDRTAQLTETIKILQDEIERRTKAEQELKERNEQIRALASELTLAEQRERQRIAGILHDHLQQLLVGAKFQLTALQRTEDEEVRKASADLVNLMDLSIETSRSLSADLSPPILHSGGLIPALHWLVRWMKQNHGLVVTLKADARAAPETEDVTILLFQAVRELLFNVVKHAQVRQATIEVSRHAEQIQVTVSDRGVGFDTKRALSIERVAEGIGLLSIRERLGYFGGGIKITSTLGEGSSLTLIAPIRHKKITDVRLTPVTKTFDVTSPEEDYACLEASSEEVEAASGEEKNRKIRVLLADDHVVMREGLTHIIKDEEDLEIVGEAENGEEAVRLARSVHPDVIVMDVSMPRLNGIDATRIIHRELPNISIIGLSMFEEAEKGEAMYSAGAAAYLAKSGATDLLLDAIRSCVA